jgi:hypothetical protein
MPTISPLRPVRGAAALLGALALGATFALTTASAPARAAAAAVTCTGSHSVSYSPGLLLAPRPVAATARYALAQCISTDPGVTAGTSTVTLTNTISCLTLDNAGTGVLTLDWSNGRSSTFTFTRTATHPAGQTVVLATGAITGGEFAGDAATLIVTDLSVDLLACLAPPGVTGTSGRAVLTITST